MATIRKRRTGWQVQVRRINHSPISKTFRLKSDAEVWARQKEVEIDDQTEPGEQFRLRGLKVRHLLEKYELEVTSTKKSQSQEKAIINQLLQESFADCPIDLLEKASNKMELVKTIYNLD